MKRTHFGLTESILVWVLYEGLWYEEMINSRARVQVTAMQWSGDGDKICIAYRNSLFPKLYLNLILNIT